MKHNIQLKQDNETVDVLVTMFENSGEEVPENLQIVKEWLKKLKKWSFHPKLMQKSKKPLNSSKKRLKNLQDFLKSKEKNKLKKKKRRKENGRKHCQKFQNVGFQNKKTLQTQTNLNRNQRKLKWFLFCMVLLPEKAFS